MTLEQSYIKIKYQYVMRLDNGIMVLNRTES